jgi:chromosome segregation ATPase
MENLDSLTNDHNLAIEQISQLQKTVSFLQTSQKKLEESSETSESKYRSEIEYLQKKALSSKQENESLRRDLESTRSKWEQTKKEILEKDNRLKKLTDDLASEKQKLSKSDEYNLEILREMKVTQGELKTLRERPKNDQLIAEIKSELAKALDTSAEISEQLEHQRAKTSAMEEELRNLKEINSKWETTIRTMAEHIIGRKNRGLQNQSLSGLMTNAYAAINRTKVLQDVQQSEKNQSEELDFLTKLTAQSGLYNGQGPSKENY